MVALEVKDHPDYAITPDGRVWSKKSKAFLVPDSSPNGYLRVTLDGEKVYIHRLVAENYISHSEGSNRDLVCHRNRNKEDNRVENLCWASRSAAQTRRFV